ncbi:hypothetical protein B0H19DRAFT_246306 [Mycena capillaripes]|nr:hypothetical protein B0H19DRAFT_246306 [Mycena capillaripes]
MLIFLLDACGFLRSRTSRRRRPWWAPLPAGWMCSVGTDRRGSRLPSIPRRPAVPALHLPRRRATDNEDSSHHSTARPEILASASAPEGLRRDDQGAAPGDAFARAHRGTQLTPSSARRRPREADALTTRGAFFAGFLPEWSWASEGWLCCVGCCRCRLLLPTGLESPRPTLRHSATTPTWHRRPPAPSPSSSPAPPRSASPLVFSTEHPYTRLSPLTPTWHPRQASFARAPPA